MTSIEQLPNEVHQQALMGLIERALAELGLDDGLGGGGEGEGDVALDGVASSSSSSLSSSADNGGATPNRKRARGGLTPARLRAMGTPSRQFAADASFAGGNHNSLARSLADSASFATAAESLGGGGGCGDDFGSVIDDGSSSVAGQGRGARALGMSALEREVAALKEENVSAFIRAPARACTLSKL